MIRGFLVAILVCLISAASAQQKFVYPLPADSAVHIRVGIPYKTTPAQPLHFDLYRPSNHASGAALPVVVFMQGVGGDGFRTAVQYVGWGKLVTSAGTAGVVYESHTGSGGENGIAEDARDLLKYLHQHATDLHIDAGRVVLWACSSNVAEGLPLAMDPSMTAIKAAVFFYGVTEEVKHLRLDLPIMVVRAGLDSAGLNRGLDQFVTRASAANVPLTFIKVPGAHHGFDILDDNDTSRAVIARTLEFMKTQISPAAQREILNNVTDASAAAAIYREDWAEAVSAYRKLTQARPGDSELHRNFGRALYATNQFKDALSEFERALQLNSPNVGLTTYAAATACMKLGDTDAALRWIEKLKDIAPMRRRLVSDPDFAALRDNPRFRAVAEVN